MENRMGGILSAYLLPLSEVASAETTRACINVILQTGCNWHDCHCMHMKSQPEDQIQVNDGGVLCDSVITIDTQASEDEYQAFKGYLSIGCLIKVIMSNGETLVYGTYDYPMVGGIIKVVGSEPSEATCYRITASNGTFDGPLRLL